MQRQQVKGSRIFEERRGAISKVEPRLQGFKLKEIFFKNVQIKWNQTEKQAGMKSELFENHTIINEISWYNLRAIRKSKHYWRNRLVSQSELQENQTGIV